MNFELALNCMLNARRVLKKGLNFWVLARRNNRSDATNHQEKEEDSNCTARAHARNPHNFFTGFDIR